MGWGPGRMGPVMEWVTAEEADMIMEDQTVIMVQAMAASSYWRSKPDTDDYKLKHDTYRVSQRKLGLVFGGHFRPINIYKK